MIPGFALSLSFEGISLLQKAAGGWRLVGEVAVDSPDLSRDLASLRDRAGLLADGPLRCKVIIPNDQVRYVSVATGNFEGAALDAMVHSALDGATPYPVAELKYDTSDDGETTFIAAVVSDTLAEAESFAVEHGFNPVCVVAAPGDNPFLGEPFFGPTVFAAGLADVDGVESDGIAVVVIGTTDGFVVEPEALVEAKSESETATESRPEPELAGFSSRRNRAKSDNAHEPDLDTGSETETESDPDSSPVVFRSAKAKAQALTEAQVAHQPQPEPISVTAPGLEVPESDQTAAGQADPAAQDVPEPSGIGGFLSRRKRGERVEPSLQPRTDSGAERSLNAPRVSTPTPLDHGGTGPTLTAISRPTDSAFVAANPDSPHSEEAARMTVFGARGQADIGGKPRHLGLMLSAALLLFLAAVAAWASVFLEDGVAGLFRSATPRTELAAVPDTPAIGVKAEDPATPVLPDDTALAPAANAPPAAPASEPATLPAADIEIAALPAPRRLTAPDQPSLPVSPASPTLALPALTDTDSAVLEALRTPVQDDSQPQLPDSETATADDTEGTPGLTAAFELLDTAPLVPRTPSIIGLDDLYVASIDRTDLSQDAVALPTVAMLDTDLPLGEVSSPVAAGTAFDLNAAGLVLASVEGTLNPDGVMIFLGRPDVVPPQVPVRFRTAPETDTARTRLAGFRPRLRPSDLEERFDRNNLGGLTRAELSGLRPKHRPKSLQQNADPEQAPTAQAVASSVGPRSRPKDFTAIVSAAVRLPTQDEAAVATIPPATVTPNIPSSASVARQATLKNEINLRRVNLIGVYGTPSNRRALVRLPSGRYKKVKVGDTVDGGRVVAIGDSELRYQKSGRSLTLKIPSS